MPDTYTNSIGMEFTLIPAGSFMMGCNASFENCVSPELPQHQVHIASPFYLGVTEVTQEQWVSVMGSNPSEFKGRTNPVEQVSWNNAHAFIRDLNTKEGCSDCYRLPSEAEWEYAARAGTTTAYWFGDSADDLGQYAWFYDNSNGKTHPVGQTPANPWGLYDMHGNVFEWVQDCYHRSSGRHEIPQIHERQRQRGHLLKSLVITEQQGRVPKQGTGGMNRVRCLDARCGPQPRRLFQNICGER